MWDVRACRVCLTATEDVRLFPLLANQLEQRYQVVIGDNVDHEMGLPQYLCWECTALVHKYYCFRQRCLQGQMTLLDIYRTHDEVTLDEIKKVDRHKTELASRYAVIHRPSTEFVQESVTHSEHQEEVKVKEEPTPTGAPVSEVKDYVDVEIKEEEKNDDSFLGYTSPVNYSTDEDDEPLALRRSKLDTLSEPELQALAEPEPGVEEPGGELKKRKKYTLKKKRKRDIESTAKRKRKEKEPEDVSKEELKVEVNEPKIRKKRVPTEIVEPRVPKKRGPKPSAKSKDEAEMEDYVTIIKLSVDEQMREVLSRRESANYKNAPLKCDVCFKGFVDTDAFRNHVVKHEPVRGEVECPICKFRFADKRTLQKHAANHEKKYQCKSCPYISKTTTQAKQHQKWHKGITYKCQYCDEVSTKWTSYLSHVRIKHPSEHICGVCGYSFVSKLGLAMHKTMMHKESQLQDVKKDAPVPSVGPYCKECDVQFTSRQAYKRHMVTSAKHTANNEFGNGCRVCGETFPTAEELRVHHRKQHARKRPKNYGKKPSDMVWPIKCVHCEDEIPNAREYWTHFRRAHPDKKYPIKKSFVCEICGKEFRGNAFLVYHKRTHFEERMYKCNQCSKSFFNRTNLMMHEKTHSDHRPYPCTVCFKAFKLKGALDRHFRSHTGVKPYECEFCGKAFGQSNSRKLHVRTVHLKQPAPYISKNRMERRRAAAEAVKIPPPFPY